jgi:molecular chaperone DnaK (HSP70)
MSKSVRSESPSCPIFPVQCPTCCFVVREARGFTRLLLTCSIVANEQGSFTTPSFVSFTDQERLIGEAAKNQAAMNPRNTVFDIK